jgi:hypothetical protein
VGWRNIVEKMHMTATLTKWYEERGRHEIFAAREEKIRKRNAEMAKTVWFVNYIIAQNRS